MTNIAKVKYLIVGNSAGGIAAAEAIRGVDKRGSLTIVSDEPYPAYSRPLISDYLAGKCSLEGMLYRPADFYEKNNINSLLGVKAERLDVDKRLVELENGQQIRWEKLLLATGGMPIVPRMEGVERSGVFSFTTLDDAKAIDRFLKGPARAVVIGGGLIGVSVTEALVKRGVKVTVVEMKERILNVMLDEVASDMENEALRQSGVEIITDHTVTVIGSDLPEDNSVSYAVLDDGRRLPCNLVVVAIGVLPRTELMSGTGIKVNRGIVVDLHMTTSSPDVYACGDVAEAYDFIYGENRNVPIWPNAYIGGRVAGLNMAGVPTEYRGGTAANSLKYFGLDIVSAGMVTPPDGDYEVLSQQNDNGYRKVVFKDGLVAGMVFTGDIEKSGIILSLMKDGVNVDSFKSALIADDFSLFSLPEEIWRRCLEPPPSATASAETAREEPEEVAIGE